MKTSSLTPLLSWPLCLSLFFTIAQLAFSQQLEEPQADQQEPAEAAEHPLNGSWEMQVMMEDGEKVPLDDVYVLDFKDGVLSGSSADDKFEGKFVLDDSKDPKWLDLILIEDGEEMDAMLCLYRVEGDVLIICNDTFDMDTKRPESLKPKEDNMVVMFKRLKDGEEKPQPEEEQQEEEQQEVAEHRALYLKCSKSPRWGS